MATNPIRGLSSKKNFIRGLSTAGTPQRGVENYQTRLGLSGISDEVLAKKEDPRNFVEKALNTPKQAGLLGDILDVLSRANYASANIAKEVTDKEKSSVLDVLKAGWEGLSGQERTSYADVLEQSGMKPGIARSALGFVGDVVLDPTTYATLGASAAGKTALKLGGKAIPGTAKAIETAGKAVSPLRELAAGTKVGETFGKTLQGFRFRPSGVAKDEFKPWVETVEQFQKDYRVKPQRAMEEAIKEGKKFTTEEQKLAGKIREIPSLATIAPETVRQYAQKWAGVNKDLLTKAEKAGLKINEIDDYLAHVPGEDFASISKKAKAETLGGRTDPLRVYDPNKRARTLEGTVEEINQRMGGEFFEQRMPVADAIRNARLERAISTQEFLNKVVSAPEWAIPVKKGSSVPPGWKIFEPEGPFRFYPTETGIGVTKNVPRYAVPEHVGEYLEEAMKTFKDDKATERLKSLYLNTQRLWTVSVTGLNPGYHVRNIQGNIFNSFLAGMKSPRPIMDAMGIALGKEGKTSAGLDYAQLAKEFKDEGLDISNFFSRETGEDVLSAVRRQVSGQRDKPLDAIRNATSKVEGNAKMALFIDQRNKGKSVKEASDVVKKYLFDYQDLTQAERKIKMTIPFYTWSRKNIPLQFESMITQPGKYAGVAKGVNAIEDMSEPTVAEGDLPEWFKEEGVVRTPFKNSKGEQIYWLPNLPYLDVNTLGARDIYSRISPLLKAIPELLANQNVSLDMPIEKYEGQTVPSPVGGKIPAKADYLLKQFGVARNVGNVASTIKGTPNARTAPEMIANLLGLSNYPLNAQKATLNTAYDLIRQYQDFLKKLEETGQRPGTLAEIKKGIGVNLGGTKKKGRGFGGI